MYSSLQLDNYVIAGKLEASTSLVGEVDESLKCPLPHVYDYNSGRNFLIYTGSSIFVVKPTAHDKGNQIVDQYLSAANGSCIATYGNKSVTLKFVCKQNFHWTFVS